MRVCKFCRVEKPEADFGTVRGRSTWTCRECRTKPHTCRGCGKVRTLAAFRYFGGTLATRCNECRRQAKNARDEKSLRAAAVERRCHRCRETFNSRGGAWHCGRCRDAITALSWQGDA